jgi:hypothetical protein
MAPADFIADLSSAHLENMRQFEAKCLIGEREMSGGFADRVQKWQKGINSGRAEARNITIIRLLIITPKTQIYI